MKSGIRKFAAACPNLPWWEFLPDIVRAMRTIPARATGFSPYILVYKQSPVLTMPAALGPYDEDELSTVGE